jgi:hypothetical protein
MAEFELTKINEEKENIREVFIDLDNLPDSLVYRLEEVEFTYSAARFGMGWQDMDYYYNRIPAGLMEQFPCLSYMLEDYWKEATKMTPLEEIEYRRNLAENKNQ